MDIKRLRFGPKLVNVNRPEINYGWNQGKFPGKDKNCHGGLVFLAGLKIKARSNNRAAVFAQQHGFCCQSMFAAGVFDGADFRLDSACLLKHRKTVLAFRNDVTGWNCIQRALRFYFFREEEQGLLFAAF